MTHESTLPQEMEIDYDDPRFNQGVQHVVDMLSRAIGAEGWVAGDGSEDYDCDLEQTLLNILAAKGLYDKDEGEFAVLTSRLCEDCPPTGYPTDKTRCKPCPRRSQSPAESGERERMARIIDPAAWSDVDDPTEFAARQISLRKVDEIRGAIRVPSQPENIVVDPRDLRKMLIEMSSINMTLEAAERQADRMLKELSKFNITRKP